MQANKLTGIAALAASGDRLATKRKVEYRSLPSKSILNRCSNPRLPFRWTINPYRGCEIGCHYCYATYTHQWLGVTDPARFHNLIYSKEQVAGLLWRDLERGVKGPIAIGTGTDPYQPAERRFETTRAILEVLAEVSGLSVGIMTKSDLVLRDLDLLGRVASRNTLHVSLTVTTLEPDLARLLEPRAVRPDRRIRAVRELRWRGVTAGVFTAPVLPLITDSKELLSDVARAAKRVDASYWSAQPLFLRRPVRARMMPFLEDRFPQLAARYKAHYRSRVHVSGDYRAWLDHRVDGIRREHGLAGRIPVDVAGNDGWGAQRMLLPDGAEQRDAARSAA